MATGYHWFNDLYHGFDDDEDLPNDSYLDFDDLYINFHQPIDIKYIHEEGHLQSTTGDIDSTIEQQTIDELSNLQIFKQMITPVLEESPDSIITMKDLQDILLLKHKLAVLDLNRALYTTYLKSGTNKLKEDDLRYNQSYLAIWPESLKTTILRESDGKLTRKDLNYEKCLNYVQNKLEQFQKESVNYQMELHRKKKDLHSNFTVEMEETINQFIEQYRMNFYRIPIEAKIAIVKHEYDDRLLRREFNLQQPYQPQVE